MQPASAPAGGTAVSTDRLAQAYLALTTAYAQAKTDPVALTELIAQADALAARVAHAADLASKARGLQGKGLAAQRGLFRGVSEAAIKLLQQHPPMVELFIAHCPTVNADRISPRREIRNPYGTSMLSCGSITGALKPVVAIEDKARRCASRSRIRQTCHCSNAGTHLPLPAPPSAAVVLPLGVCFVSIRVNV